MLHFPFSLFCSGDVWAFLMCTHSLLLSHGKTVKFGKRYGFKWFFKQIEINSFTLYLDYTIICYRGQSFLVLIKKIQFPHHFATAINEQQKEPALPALLDYLDYPVISK